MKELSKNEMQAVSGAGLFDSVFGAIGNVFAPVTDALAKGIAGVLAKFIELLGNKLNDDFGPKK
jgi:bacteriocin-like protein